MSRILRFIFFSLFIFSAYHIVRDILQIMGVHNWIADIMHYENNWCKAMYPGCDYYIFPWEIGTFIGSFIVLKRNKVGHLGKLILYALVIVPIIWFLNWVLG